MNIKELKPDRISLISILVINLVAPGALGIFFFYPKIFAVMDTVKFIFISACISAPFLVLAYVLFNFRFNRLSVLEKENFKGDNLEFAVLAFTCLNVSIIWVVIGVVDFCVLILFPKVPLRLVAILSAGLFLEMVLCWLLVLDNKISKVLKKEGYIESKPN